MNCINNKLIKSNLIKLDFLDFDQQFQIIAKKIKHPNNNYVLSINIFFDI